MNMLIQGKVFRFGDDIATDYILSGKNRLKGSTISELLPYLFAELRPDFTHTVRTGDLIVAGENFSCGSSRELAAQLIKSSGIRAVLAKSFARIFYRNAINIGLPPIICDTDWIQEAEKLTVDLKGGTVTSDNTGKSVRFTPFSKNVRQILDAGGLVNFIWASIGGSGSDTRQQKPA